MKKHRYIIHFITFFLGATITLPAITGSRRMYRKKKKQTPIVQQERVLDDFLGKNMRTHIDIANISNAEPTPKAAVVLPKPLPLKKSPNPNFIARIDNPPLPAEMQTQESNITENLEVNDNQEEDIIELYFENADLENFIKQIEDIFEVTFVTDDSIQPIAKDRKQIRGNKISFKTHQPLSKKEVWNLFVTLLEIAGFAVIQQPDPTIFRITTIAIALKSPIPAFIGVDPTTLPETDELIRYVYFIENANIDTLKAIIDPLRSTASSLIALKEHKAFVLTDKAYNIKTLMKIIKELDKVSIPETMSILKLRNADAKQIAELYQSLLPKEETSPRFFSRKQPTSLYFPENTRIIAEPRTNALILLGPKDAIKQIEEFVVKHIDVELDQAYSPLYVHQLRYADATTVATIMNEVTQFGKDTDAGKSGGVRGVDQYMRPMRFVPEKETNRLIIKAYYEDYLKAKKIIETLDEAQPQVAIEVLILAVSIDNRKSLGAQIRSKANTNKGLLGRNVTFQTSGLFGSKTIVENTKSNGANRLLGNLLELITGALPGNTILSLGKDIVGTSASVWGVFQILQTVTNTEIISNPFLIATNKRPALVSLGEERRVVTATVVGTTEVRSLGKDEALLEVAITPQINSDGMILLDLVIKINDFIDPADKSSAQKNTRTITTSTIVADKEVLALGGLIRNKTTNNVHKTPLLGNIPILGWLFKNKQKNQDKESLLILISSQIIDPFSEGNMREFTNERIKDYHGTLDEMHSLTAKRDPIHRMFFEGKEQETEELIEGFLFERQDKKEKKNNRLRKRVTKNQRGRRKSRTKQKPETQKHKTIAPPQPKTEATCVAQDNSLRDKIKQKKRTALSLTNFINHGTDKGSRV